MSTSKKIVYLGYFLHRGFGSSSTRHLLLEDKGNDSYGILSKMDQFTTGAMTNMLPILDEIWSFSHATGLADFCAEYAFAPDDLLSPLEKTHPELAAAFRKHIATDERFGPDYSPEHERIPPDTDLIHTLVKESGIADLFEAPLMETGTGKKQGRVVPFSKDEHDDTSIP